MLFVCEGVANNNFRVSSAVEDRVRASTSVVSAVQQSRHHSAHSVVSKALKSSKGRLASLVRKVGSRLNPIQGLPDQLNNQVTKLLTVYDRPQENMGPVTTQSTTEEQRKWPKSVFISYSTLDRTHALHLKRLLEEKDIRVWFDIFDIRTSGKIDSDLLKIIGKQDVFCLLLSPKSVESKWVEREIQVAKSSTTLRILPIILRPCNIPPELEDIIGFDAREGLERESVRDRLFRAILGESEIAGSVILDKVERELQYDKFLQDQAEEAMPEIRRAVDSLSTKPMRILHLHIWPETLPENKDTILELRLTLDTLFNGTMSFFIARYREGRTWPEEYDFEEPGFQEFFLSPQPRIDVQFKWFDRIIRLRPVIYHTWRDHDEIYVMELDGEEYKPRDSLSLPQVFEIPSLDTLIENQSLFQLVAHNPSNKVSSIVPEDSDISIELSGGVSRNQWLKLYRSHFTRDQQNLRNTPYLSAPDMNPILREILLSRYCETLGKGDRERDMVELELSVRASIQKNQYGSADERRLAGWYLFHKGTESFGVHRWRDAYEAFEKASLILQPVVMSQVPTMRDAVSMYLSVRRMVEIWMRQRSFEHAEKIVSSLMRVARSINEADPTEPDFQGILGEALLIQAEVNVVLGKKDLALESLVNSVEIIHDLYLRIPLQSRQQAWIAALSDAIRKVALWQISADHQVNEWKATLRGQIGNDKVYTALIRPPTPPSQLPVWLQDCTLEAWPTKPIKSAALRYSLKLPARWDSDYAVRGTSHSIQHIYRGGKDTNWLMIEFLENADEHGDIRHLVQVDMAISGLPVLYDLKVQPTLLQGRYIGTLSSLVTKLDADDAQAYLGIARFQVPGNLLGRIYIVLVRKGTFAWKITLTFHTACLPGAPEEMVNSNDHIRAGAILGSLQLERP